ncbi:class I SAM-dependent methyltransferase [bacterium D16-76]|nr:class I SAM-dependent methyltransferase [bacterium D16-76]
MRWDFWQRAQAFLRPGTRVLFLGPKGKDPRFPLAPEDGPFDLVLCYHAPFDLAQVYSLLKPGGFFLTQQTGGSDAQAARLGLAPDYNLENQKPLFLQAGFRVVYANQDYMDTEDGLCHCFILTAGKKGGRPC